jgi:hypothetical protein
MKDSNKMKENRHGNLIDSFHRGPCQSEEKEGMWTQSYFGTFLFYKVQHSFYVEIPVKLIILVCLLFITLYLNPKFYMKWYIL